MSSPACAILCTALLLTGCSTPVHGPPKRVVSTQTEQQIVSSGQGDFVRRTVQEARLSDAEGREWTETNVINSERVPLAQIDAELFEEARKGEEQ